MADETIRAEIVAEDKTGAGVASAKRNLAGLQRELNNGRSGFTGFSAASASASSAMSTFAAGIAGAGTVIGALGLAQLAGGIVNVGRGALQSYIEFERLGTSINALSAKEALLTGQSATMQEALAQTAESSKELLDWIQKLAIASPFRQDDVAQAFRLSMALGFSTDEAQRLTTAMINFATATGAEGYAMERIARALGQINTKGRLSLEEVNQLTEAGVDVMRILGDATGKTGKALSDSISKGAVDAKFAIEAILSDTERLYAGAAEASATSMGGIVSSLGEMNELTSRNFFTGMFKEVQPYLANILAVLSAPEFQAGVEILGERLGDFTADGLQGAADAMERIGAAIDPMLAADSPAWLTTLVGLGAAADYNFKVNIKPNVTQIETPDGGLKMEVEPYATTITSRDGGLLRVDVVANRITIDADTKDDVQPVNLVADWKEGTIGSLIAAARDRVGREKILLEAGWTPDAITNLRAVMNVQDFAIAVTPVLSMPGPANAGGGIGFDLGQQIAESIDWEQYKKDWQAAFDSWSPVASPELFKSIQDAFDSTPIAVILKLNEGMVDVLWDLVQGRFEEPITMFGSWAGTALSSLWTQVQAFFNARPLSMKVVSSTGGSDFSIYDPQIRNSLPIDVNQPYPTANYDPRYGDAIGDGFFRGGVALVGETGPELVTLPRGTQILNNRDTRALYGGSIPRFAEGTVQIPAGIRNLLSSLGLWVPPKNSGQQIGPPTRDDAYGGWRDFQRKGTEAMQGAADKAADAFESAAEKTGKAFQGALGRTPGLFGRSEVTDSQMRLAEAGVPQNFADDWLRQLNDEVLNGVEWGDNVDIKDAARRAGIDPNLPNEIILELVNQAWDNGSFFANPANLNLVNMDAVQADMLQTQKEMQGKQNLMSLFGVTDENLQTEIDTLGADIARIFGGAAETDVVKNAGVVVFGAVTGGFSDSDTANAGVANMAASIQAAAGTPDNQTALKDAGKAHAGIYYSGWQSFMGEAPVAPPGGSAGAPIGPTLPPGGVVPPGRAIGTGFWGGGWMTVHANETIFAPRGTGIMTAKESASQRGATVINNYVTVNHQIDEEAFLARMARRLRRGN